MSEKGYEKYYIPKRLDENKIIFFDRDDFLICVTLPFIGMMLDATLLFIVLTVVAIKIWRHIKTKEHNIVPNLKYKYFGEMLKLKRSPASYKKKYYG